MPLSDEMRRLQKKWTGQTGWPKRLDWIEVQAIRGWTGQRVEFKFPIVAIVGENGSGKSTLLQSAACAYQSGAGQEDTRYASEFFPDTAWDQIRKAEVRFGYKEGAEHKTGSIRKQTTRWLGNVDRPVRSIEYIDLSRIQPVSARVGYAKIAKNAHTEVSSTPFDTERLNRFSSVMGRSYDGAKFALCSIDDNRLIPVISKSETPYSGFHQGSGETVAAEFLQADLPKYGLVLIDEIESSLHPRTQRRLIRDLADRCRERELQIILTTHSPYVLEELPMESRIYILETEGSKRIVAGVSPQFAMTQMDDVQHPECELYVEDAAAKVLLAEILAAHAKHLFPRCDIIPFGAASVGFALGQMVVAGRFPRPTCVFLDGDNAPTPGCVLLPGGDAPEQVVFKDLRARRWGDLWARIGRDMSAVIDACNNAMTLNDHHDWVRSAATTLMCGGDTLWQAMCAEWAKEASTSAVAPVVDVIEQSLP
ncbi:MAG: AAA family ATPase [Hyphomicrobium sp.]|uniref:ATP-dependent nuclease n=1 Tax=Hyphomicrobium sp. TaxID=82 RepID=UPI0039E46344